MVQVYETDQWPNELLVIIGEIVIAAGQLEYILDLSIKRSKDKKLIEGLKEADSHKYRKINAKLDLIKKSATEFSRKTQDEVAHICNAVQKAWDRRNRVIHAFYGIQENRKRIRNVKSKGPGGEYSRKNLGVEVEEFRNIRDDLRYCRSLLNDITREMFLGRQATKRM